MTVKRPTFTLSVVINDCMLSSPATADAFDVAVSSGIAGFTAAFHSSVFYKYSAYPLYAQNEDA